ncbi:MAG: efflux transporter outer membrane subunit, partial [Trinickia sp.]
SDAGELCSFGPGYNLLFFLGGACRASRSPAFENSAPAGLNNNATVLSAFQNVADTLAALEHDAETLASADTAAGASRTGFEETAARHRLGALPPSAERASEQQYLNAELDAIRATSRRLTDTASLFQAMGEVPADERS